ncbi:MAG: prolipoprotein diacylglyceryl transferase [Burkholderiales bacterium]|nr:prolipoprotein diacylglyceryl transferase [Burkholderiales bacterium]
MISDIHWAAPVHAAFEFAGIGIGAAMYRRARRIDGQGSIMAPSGFAVLVGLLLGAGIGNKLVFLIERPDVVAQWLSGHWIAPGQSIVGGLLGGLIGVEFAKAATHQKRSTGDLMVLPIATGIVIGRIGCFLAGLYDDTYGVVTALPWGVDFGDGLNRHPTQLYEMLFVCAWAALLLRQRKRWQPAPGLMFKLFLSGYLVWRLGVEGIKPVLVIYPLGLSGIQWVCIASLLLYLPWVVHSIHFAKGRAMPCKDVH